MNLDITPIEELMDTFLYTIVYGVYMFCKGANEMLDSIVDPQNELSFDMV